MQELMMTGRVMPSEEADAAKASEGRWPRICERSSATAARAVRCDHVN
jgi:hypothetical protein